MTCCFLLIVDNCAEDAKKKKIERERERIRTSLSLSRWNNNNWYLSICLFWLLYISTNEKAIHQNIDIKERNSSQICRYMINNEQILICVHDHHKKQMNIFSRRTIFLGDKQQMIFCLFCFCATTDKRYLPRNKHRTNYRLFDLLENNDSCYTLIYCFHDKKKNEL